MKFQLFQRVILTESIPEESLEIGDVGTVVEHYRTPSGEPDGYEVEFFQPVAKPWRLYLCPRLHCALPLSVIGLLFVPRRSDTGVPPCWACHFEALGKLSKPAFRGKSSRAAQVDASDLALVAGAFITQDHASDVNADGRVDIFDLVLVGRNFGRANH